MTLLEGLFYTKYVESAFHIVCYASFVKYEFRSLVQKSLCLWFEPQRDCYTTKITQQGTLRPGFTPRGPWLPSVISFSWSSKVRATQGYCGLEVAQPRANKNCKRFTGRACSTLPLKIANSVTSTIMPIERNTTIVFPSQFKKWEMKSVGGGERDPY